MRFEFDADEVIILEKMLTNLGFGNPMEEESDNITSLTMKDGCCTIVFTSEFIIDFICLCDDKIVPLVKQIQQLFTTDEDMKAFNEKWLSNKQEMKLRQECEEKLEKIYSVCKSYLGLNCETAVNHGLNSETAVKHVWDQYSALVLAVIRTIDNKQSLTSPILVQIIEDMFELGLKNMEIASVYDKKFGDQIGLILGW